VIRAVVAWRETLDECIDTDWDLSKEDTSMPESKTNLVLVDAWIGESGVPGRISTLVGESSFAAAQEMLREQGCGAWRGRTACGDPATWVLLGGPGLYFMVYRSVHHPGSPVIATVCDRHAGILSQQVVRDMPASLRKEHERMFRKHLKLRGVEKFEQQARIIALTRLDDELT
jgi:hypothetical protein